MSSLQTELDALVWAIKNMLQHSKYGVVLDYAKYVSTQQMYDVFWDSLIRCKKEFLFCSITHIPKTNIVLFGYLICITNQQYLFSEFYNFYSIRQKGFFLYSVSSFQTNRQSRHKYWALSAPSSGSLEFLCPLNKKIF